MLKISVQVVRHFNDADNKKYIFNEIVRSINKEILLKKEIGKESLLEILKTAEKGAKIYEK